MLELIGYQTEKGLYYTNAKMGYNGRQSFNAGLVNNKPRVVSKYKDDWYFLEGEETITSIKNKAPSKCINFRWELRDKSVAMGDKIPEVISCEDACEQESDYEYYFGRDSKYAGISGLYQRVYDYAPEEYNEVEFTLNIRGFVQAQYVENNVRDIKYVVQKSRDWSHEGTTEVTKTIFVPKINL